MNIEILGTITLLISFTNEMLSIFCKFQTLVVIRRAMGQPEIQLPPNDAWVLRIKPWPNRNTAEENKFPVSKINNISFYLFFLTLPLQLFK